MYCLCNTCYNNGYKDGLERLAQEYAHMNVTQKDEYEKGSSDGKREDEDKR